MECVQIDINNICRTCKGDSPEMKSLYYRDSESGKENPRLDEMLMACASVQVNNDDGLPKVICRSCYVLLKNAYAFKEQCERTDVFFKEYLEKLKKTNVKEETLAVDLEYSASFIGDISTEQANVGEDKNGPEEIKDDPEVHTEQVAEKKDMDYVQVFDENITIYKCRTCCKDFYTLEGLKFHKRVHSGKTYVCKQCNKSYTRSHHLYRHELSHMRTKVCVCKICNKTLTRLDHLKRHLITHLKEKPFTCSKCCRGFNRAQHLENHVTRCKGEKVYICDICNKAFNRQDSMEVHRKMHQNKCPELPTLESLDNISKYYMEIDYDEKTVFIDESEEEEEEDGEEDFDVTEETLEPEVEVSENRDQIPSNEIGQITQEMIVEEDPPEMLKQANIKEEISRECGNADIGAGNDDCDSDDSKHSEYLPIKHPLPKIKRGRGRPRKYPVSYKPTGRPRGRPPFKHKIKTEPQPESESETGRFECQICHMVLTTRNLLEKHAEQQHHGLKLHECETCNKKFSRMTSYKRHKMVHLETKPFVCGTCLKCFSRRDHMQKHMRLHNSADVHTCDVCQAIFSRAENLMRHQARKHGKGESPPPAEKKFQCDYCAKAFTTLRYRDSHMKAHLGERRHQCKTCEKTFISKSHLTEHMKFHSESSKNFLCAECGQRFIRNDYLVIHMRRHRGEKPFKCKFCGKGFPRTTDLTVHERYHTGEKTHLCVICGRGFGRAYNLTVHMRTHTGEKPYRCTHCDAAFAQGNDLKAHIRRHTGERFQCDMCPETFLMGYLLTQHKRVVHGLNIVSNIRRLKPVNTANPDDPPLITVPLPAPVIVSTAVMVDPLQINKTEILTEELKLE